jgi:hypothetical protein
LARRGRGGGQALGQKEGAALYQGRIKEREERKGKGEKKRKEKKEKENRRREKKIKEKGEKENWKRRKRFRNLGKVLGILGGRGNRFLWSFSGFSDTDIRSGTTVMARRSGRQDRGGRGIPGVVADSGAGAACGGRRPERGRCRRNSRHARRG